MSSRCALRREDREELQTWWQVFDPGGGEVADTKCNAKVFIPTQHRQRGGGDDSLPLNRTPLNLLRQKEDVCQ
jgi:hypothetical protein